MKKTLLLVFVHGFKVSSRRSLRDAQKEQRRLQKLTFDLGLRLRVVMIPLGISQSIFARLLAMRSRTLRWR